MFEKIKRYPILLSLLLALGLYIIAFLAVLIWLSINADVTAQRRIAQSPSVTIVVKKPAITETTEDVPADAMPDASPVPSSWDSKEPTAADETKPVDAAPADNTIEQDQPPAQAEVDPKAPDVPSSVENTSPAAIEEPKPETAGPIAEAPAPLAAWQKMARPFNTEDLRPRIGLIVINLGVIGHTTKMAIENLPADVTLAFQSVAPAASAWIEKSKAAGHENLLAIPMEPYRYPQNDPGPQTLLTLLPKEENIKRLNAAMTDSTNVIGVMPSQGEKFITDERSMAPVLDEIKKTGLIFVDGTHNANSAASSLTRLGRIPFVQTQLVIDASASRQAIDQALTELENIAKKEGQVIATILPYPVTFERLDSWIKSLPEKNLQLAPVSALIVKDKATAPAPTAAPATETTAPVEANIPSAPSEPVTASTNTPTAAVPVGKFPDTAGPAPAPKILINPNVAPIRKR